MSGETEKDVSGWTVDTLAHHLEKLRDLDEALATERDRRYREVSVEREKALKIKETGDAEAMRLARDAQQFRDLTHNGLLQQWQADRAVTPTRKELEAVEDKVLAELKAEGASLL